MKNKLLLAIIILSLLIGFYNINNFEFRYSDEAYFFAEASALIGNGYLDGIEPLSSFKPLYIGVLAFLIKLFGPTPYPILILNVFAWTASVYLVYLIGRELASEKVAIASALIMALTKLNITFVKSALSDTILNLFILLSVYFFIIAWKREKKLLYFLCGVSASLAFHTKPLGIVAFLLVFVFMVYSQYMKLDWRNITYVAAGILSVFLFFEAIYMFLGYNLLNQYLYYFLGAIGRFSLGERIISGIGLDTVARIPSTEFPGAGWSNQLMNVYYFFATFSYTIIIAFLIGLNYIRKSKLLILWFSTVVLSLILIGYGVPRVLLIITPIFALIAGHFVNLDIKFKAKRRSIKFGNILAVVLLLLTLIDIVPVLTYVPGYANTLKSINGPTISNNPTIVAYYTQSDSRLPVSPEELDRLINEGYETAVYFSWYDYRVQDDLREELKTVDNELEYHIEDWRVADELYRFSVWAKIDLITDAIQTTQTKQTLQIHKLTGK